MYSDLDVGITLVALAPFFAAVLAPFVFRFVNNHAGWVLAIIPASIFIYLLSFVEQMVHRQFVSAGFDWIPAYNLRLSFYLDGLSVTFALLISGIGTFIVLYSGAYLKGHAHQGRFLSFLLMFMGSMLGLVLSDNMISLFVFWELTAITSFLLIGFDHVRQASRRAAIQALVVTGGGGLALLAGFIILNQLTGQWELSSLFGWGAAIRETDLYVAILVLVLLGAFTKSAQFPFHFWLPNAMEAPTPVSAYLHSATMVKAGIYLLMRMNPILGGSTLWGIILPAIGGVTLLWGATMALKQTDLKQMLAQTTIASLGLLVMLIGVGTEAAFSAVVLYLLGHAFYKGALFMVSGSIYQATGTRDVRELGGLWKMMPLTFLGALVGVAGMAGIPATVAFIAKEEMYAILFFDDISDIFINWQNTLVVAVMVLGNAMMMAVGLTILFKAFLGPLKATCKKAHEGSLSLWMGVLVLGGFSIWAGTHLDYFGHTIMAPFASSIANIQIDSHIYMSFKMLTTVPFALSVLTWVLGIVIYLSIPDIRGALRGTSNALGWSFDKLFDFLMFGLVRVSSSITRFFHHGRLEIYLLVVFVGFALALIVPIWNNFQIPDMPSLEALSFYEWAIFGMAMMGLLAVLTAKTRLVAIVSLGIQGFAVALFFILFGAPDLGFTQFMVETLSVVILALVMTRLHLDQRDPRVPSEIFRDGSVAIIVGVGITALMFTVLQSDLDMRLSDFFTQTSVPLAHGHNIVNVILVDYRGLDTLGEIAVVMTTGIAILALIRIRGGGPQTGVGALAPKTNSSGPKTKQAKKSIRKTSTKTSAKPSSGKSKLSTSRTSNTKSKTSRSKAPKPKSARSNVEGKPA